MITIDDLVSKIRMPIESFEWKPEIDGPGYKVQGILFGDRAQAIQLNWPFTSMPEVVQIHNEKTNRTVKFRQRLSNPNHYYSLHPDYLIEIHF